MEAFEALTKAWPILMVVAAVVGFGFTVKAKLETMERNITALWTQVNDLKGSK